MTTSPAPTPRPVPTTCPNCGKRRVLRESGVCLHCERYG